VAAVLNLLTNGFGYFYLGQRAKGLLVFLGMRLLAVVLARVPWVLELVMLGLAVDAYRIARREMGKPRATSLLASSGILQLGLAGPHPPPEAAPPEPVAPLQPSDPAGLRPFAPLSLAALLGLVYAGLVLIAALMPDYRVLNQLHASLHETAEERIYSNPRYGIVMHIPRTWNFDTSDKGYLIQAASADGICRTGLVLDSISPMAGLESQKQAVIDKLLGENNNLRLVGQREAQLGARAGYEVTFAYDLEEDEYLMRYVLARRTMTMYSLILSNRARFDEDCRRVTDVIRLRLILPAE